MIYWRSSLNVEKTLTSFKLQLYRSRDISGRYDFELAILITFPLCRGFGLVGESVDRVTL